MAEAKAEAPVPAPKRKVPGARKIRGVKGAGVCGDDDGAGAGSAAAPIEILSIDPAEDEGFATSGTEGGKPQASPSARRDRSPTRRGAGRPDRGGDRSVGGERWTMRKPASPLSSPLRPITNYTSEGDRPARTKAKVGPTVFVGGKCCCVCSEVACSVFAAARRIMDRFAVNSCSLSRQGAFFLHLLTSMRAARRLYNSTPQTVPGGRPQHTFSKAPTFFGVGPFWHAMVSRLTVYGPVLPSLRR